MSLTGKTSDGQNAEMPRYDALKLGSCFDDHLDKTSLEKIGGSRATFPNVLDKP